MKLSIIVVLILCINISLYAGGFTLFESDILHQFVDINDQDQVTGVSDEFSEAVPESPEISQVSTSSGVYGLFIDGLKVVWGVIAFLLNIAYTPLGIFLSFDLPPIFGLLIGVPLVVIYLLAMIGFIRGFET